VKPRFWTFFLALAVAAAPSAVHAVNYLWDTGTSAGITNGNGTWGTDNFWTTTGTSLTAWGGKADSAFFGGNNTLIGTPSGTFTITVNGTQQVTTIYQDVGTTAGTSSFIFTGGFLNANTLTITGSPAAYTSMTVNSVLVSNSTANITFSMSSFYRTISLGGDNTFTQNIAINGVTNGGGLLLLNHQNALGSGTMVTFNHGSRIDLNGYSISGKTVVNNRQGGLLNTGTTKSVWSGDVTLAGGSVNTIFTAGGTGAEVEISGVITGTSVDHAVRALDNTVLRLSGNNAYVGQTILRANSTLIAGHSNALGTSWGAWIDTGATLNLNGFNVGNIPVVMQTASSKLVNNDASNAASTSGTISLLTAGFSTREIGGAGNLTLGGVISGNNAASGFSKTGAGTLTLSGNNTYSGTTSVLAGSLLVNGNHSGAGLTTVASGARIGGTGSLAGGLTITSGGLFVFNPLDPTLDVTGAVSLASNFGVASLVNADGSSINWGSVADSSYSLIGLTSSTFNGITNFGVGAAAPIGGGRTAYFTNTSESGGLSLVIVPEPGALALAALGIAAAAWALRRRHKKPGAEATGS